MARTAAGNNHSSIVKFFQSAPVTESRIIFNIVKGVMKSREAEVLALSAPAATKARKARKSKATGAKRGRPRKAVSEAVPVSDQAGEPVAASAILGENAA